MKKTRVFLMGILAFGFIPLNPTLIAQHGHLNAGAEGIGQGSKLYFTNGDLFVANSGYVKDLTYAVSGPYAGFYQGGITLTALAATVDNGGPAANHPALGAFIQGQIVSVTGPEGAEFGFWEENAAAPTLNISSGTQGGNYRFDISDAAHGAGSAGGDPYGHLHGRRFTATDEGLYTVGFKLHDISANGADFGPIHASSDTFYVNFRAIPEPGILALASLGGLALLWRLRTSILGSK